MRSPALAEIHRPRSSQDSGVIRAGLSGEGETQAEAYSSRVGRRGVDTPSGQQLSGDLLTTFLSHPRAGNVLVDHGGRQLSQLLGRHMFPYHQPAHPTPVGIRQTPQRRRRHGVILAGPGVVLVLRRPQARHQPGMFSMTGGPTPTVPRPADAHAAVPASVSLSHRWNNTTCRYRRRLP